MADVASVPLTGNTDIDGVLYGVKWADSNLTYSFVGEPAPDYSAGQEHVSQVSDVQKAAARTVLDLISSYANVTFTELVGTDADLATLRIYRDGAVTTTSVVGQPPGTSDLDGDIRISPLSLREPLAGGIQYLALMHAIGKALGLDEGNTGIAHLSVDHDTTQYSVMSTHSGHTWFGPSYAAAGDSHPQTFMMDDIAALQYLYGANYTTNAGDTTYSWDPVTGDLTLDGVLRADETDKVLETVWDGGGTDTYDFSAYATDLKVDLRPGAWTTTSADQLAKTDTRAPGGGSERAEGNIANALLHDNNPASLIENAVGGSGNDTFVGNDANNVLTGNGGVDSFVGGRGNDTIIGGDGVDIYKVSANSSNCIVTYDSMTDTFTVITPSDGTDTVTGVELFEFLDKTISAATLSLPDSEAPLLETTTPVDNATGVVRTSNIILTFSENILAGTGSFVIHNIDGTIFENVPVTESSRVALSGSTVTINPTLEFAAGASYFITIDENAVHDAAGNAFSGIASTTALNFVVATAAPISGSSRNDTLNGTIDGDTINGLGGNDTISGLDGNDILDGGAGNDKLTGGAGHDALNGGAGTDTLLGGVGDDVYFVDVAADVIQELTGQGTDTVHFTSTKANSTYTLSNNATTGNIENLRLDGTANINGTGNGQNNILTGNSGKNTLTGGGGNDTLNGGSGTDRLVGGTGNDTYIIDAAGTKTVTESSGAGTDIVLSAFTYTLATNVENLTLTGSGNIDGTGNASNNILTGNSGNNTLNGGTGADALTGGLGLDLLTGGSGADRFVFNLPTDGLDRVTDFVSGSDKLQISASGFGHGLVAGQAISLLVVADVGLASVAGSNGYFIFDNAGASAGSVYWDPTGGDSSDAIAFVTLNALSISASDFLIA
ncbi:MAG: Ig-like domain-containing protein [Devosia sp.]